jgi:CheY-like chemotaxis protein
MARNCRIFSGRGFPEGTRRPAYWSPGRRRIPNMVASLNAQARGKVLVVDDDAVVLAVLKDWLEAAGYSVTVREQALGTAQWVLREKPDFVLLDVKMPALSGVEITQIIRRDQNASNAAVILHSGMDSDALEELARSSGALGALQKTHSERLFIAGFERLVAAHRANRTSAATRTF